MTSASPHHVERRAISVIRDRMTEEPVVLLEGPRSVGKSTLLKSLADARNAEVIDLDDLATRDAVLADPALFMAGMPPVCVDEYQKAPLVLDAIKAQLNKRTRPGRFLLAGSTRYDALPTAAQSLTGRLNRITIYPLTQAEIEGHASRLVETLFSSPASAIQASASKTTREEYIQRIARGGFPIAIERTTVASRNRWFDDYIRLTLERDARELSNIRQSAMLPLLLGRLASQTAQVLNIASAAADITLDERTADSYTKLLEAVFLVQRLPAWHSTLTARTAATPKLHIIDSGVAARLLRLTPEKLARRDATSLTEFGYLLETFVVGEIQREASWMDGVAGIGHWRTHDHDEVDLVIERDDGAIIAFEIKAGSRVPGESFAPMRKLRDKVGDAFIAGVALYLGEWSYTFDDRLHVMPVDRLWSV